MYYKGLTISKRLQIADTAITNAATEPIITYLDGIGYDLETINKGRELLDKAQELYRKQNQELLQQKEATAARDVLREKINKVYLRHAKLAKIAFKEDNNLLSSLGLTGKRLQAFIDWKKQVEQFYDIALGNEHIKMGLKRFKIQEEELLNAKTSLIEVNNAEALQKKELSDAQQATVEKDKALLALDKWIESFFAVSKIALENEPQLLEALGLTTKR
jgi:transcriptional antiterminator Rof (Rho-off)